MLLLLWVWLSAAQSPAERTLLAEIETYDTQIGELDARVGALDAEALTRSNELAAKEGSAAEAEAGLGAGKAATAAQLRSYYQLKRKGLARLVFEAHDPWDLRRRIRYLLAIIRAEDARQVAYATLVTQRDTMRAEARTTEEALSGVRAQLKENRTSLDVERRKRIELIRSIRRVDLDLKRRRESLEKEWW